MSQSRNEYHSHHTPSHYLQSTKNSRNQKQINPHKQRVTQTNMVYLIGLPDDVADQKTLAKYQYCGQYGEIKKIMIKKTYFNQFASYSAYITYESDFATAMAILGINNSIFGRARIYASYGTNKYCATFIKFGKCMKNSCPFFHQIEVEKEIYEEDNKKLFQDQQMLAKSYVVKHYLEMMTVQKQKETVFTSKRQILQNLVEDGLIENQTLLKSDLEPIEPRQRLNVLKETVSVRSGLSTQCSPIKIPDCEDIIYLDDIIPKIQHKLNFSGKSILGFQPEQSLESQLITKLILSSLED